MALVDVYGRPLSSTTPTRTKLIRARYDAAATTDDNRKHWANADSLSSVAANSALVRRHLRNRSRYEVANNSYARGIVNTLSAYTIGSGPTLQLTYRGEEVQPPSMRKAAKVVESLWASWAYARKVSQKLSTMQMALDTDGEAFALFSNAKASRFTPVELDITPYEADHFEGSGYSIESNDSGIRVDKTGNPAEYAFSPYHPGDGLGTLVDPNWIPAEGVLHLFRHERPGQLRGIPKTTPALPLFAMLRRFTLATITAAETAADFAALLYSESPGDEEQIESEAWDRIEIERGALLTVPGGSRLAQLKAEHPNATYAEFCKIILLEISRCLGVPAVLALGTAENANYSSARMDLQLFYRQMEAERSAIIERDLLDRVFEEWVNEAMLIDGFLPEEFVQNFDEFEWGWRWAAPFGIDRKKEADGAAAELANHTTTLAREYARMGLDWETELRQRAREMEVMRDLGLTPQQAAPVSGGSNNEDN